VVGGFYEQVLLTFEFHQNRRSRFGAVGVKICPLPLTWPLAATTACTTVQAVINCYYSYLYNNIQTVRTAGLHNCAIYDIEMALKIILQSSAHNSVNKTDNMNYVRLDEFKRYMLLQNAELDDVS